MSEPAKPMSKPTDLAPGEYYQPANARTRAQVEAVWQLTLQRFAHDLGVSLQAAVEVFERIGRACRDTGLVAETPPTEPRERALWAKRNKGTGPGTPAAWHKR